MFERLAEFWEKYGFEILVGISIAFIIIYAIVRRGKKGTFSTDYPAPVFSSSSLGTKTRRPPQESKGEKECRRVLEKTFNKPFPKARPDFLRNPVTGGAYNLELDCFNPELNLAVEYSGVQHYKYNKFMHKNYEAFQNQKYRDYMKKTICQQYGINLIEVPYTVKVSEIEDYLLRNLKSLKYI